jgi:hypothetical protein
MDPRHLVEEIGRRIGVALALDAAGLARIMIDGELAVDFELDEAGDRLLVCSSLGVVPAGAEREAAFAGLLAANLFGDGLDGASPAFDAERGELLLWFALDESSAVDPALAAIERLVGRVEEWRTRLSARDVPAAPAGAAAPALAGFQLA